ncbi:MAG: ADOP family duplicated permease [Vicinamibacterales bacterium]
MIAALRRAVRRLGALVRRDDVEADARREIAAHLALVEEDYRRRGYADEAAARAARLAVGGVDQVLERHRDARSFAWLEDLRHDLGHACRAFVRAPGVAATATATLALGLGATTAVATVTGAVLLRPLPFGPAPERLVRLVASTPNPGADAPPRPVPVAVSLDEARALDAATDAIGGVGLWSPTVVALTGFDDAGHVGAARVSSSTLALLDAQPLVGRRFGPDDDAGDSGAALLGEAAWRRWFNADPAVVGRSLTVQTALGRRRSQTVVIVGVLPSRFTFPAADTALWLALPPAAGAEVIRAPLLARLAPGATTTAALDAIGPAVRAWRRHGRDVRLALVREQEQLVGPVRPALLVLTAAVAVLLLIAALNVTSLLLARALARDREFALRAALGASRGRLVRQSLAESLILGTAGGAAGLVVAAAGLAAFRRLASPLARIDLGSTGVGWGATAFPRLGDASLDATIVAAAFALAVVVGLGIGLAAAFSAGRAGVGASIRVGGATAAGGRAGRALRRGLVVAQVAGALPLLVGAVLLGRSLQHLAATDPGFSSGSVLTFQVALPAAAYPDARLQAFAETLAEGLRQRPGVRHAGYANQLPMVALRDTAGGLWTTPDASRAPAPDAADARLVSRDYLAAIGVDVIAGRGFAAGDGAGQPRVLLVNEALARRQFPGLDPIGRSAYVGRDTTPWTIVGVVADVRQFGLDRAPEPQFFVDLRQWHGGLPLFPTGAYFVVATDGRPESVVADLRALVRRLDAGAAVYNVARLDAIVASTLTRPRLYAVALAAFAGLGALLAAIGLYGVLACLVLERTAEIGVRRALGASRGAVLTLMLRQGAGLVALGIGFGLVAARGLERALASLLYGVEPGEATTTAAAVAFFVAVAALAVIVPARRAGRIDPLAAIRSE